MPRFAAFLRAINVGGRRVRKEALIEIFAAAGASDCRTLLASGNVVFTSRARSAGRLESRLEVALAAALDFEVDVFVRSSDELAAVLDRAPVAAQRIGAAAAAAVLFLKDPLTREQETALDGLRTADDELIEAGREIWWLGRKKQSEAAFSVAAMERALGLRATARGVPTLEKARMMAENQEGRAK